MNQNQVLESNLENRLLSPIPFDDNMNQNYRMALAALLDEERRGTLAERIATGVRLQLHKEVQERDFEGIRIVEDSASIEYIKNAYPNPYIRFYLTLPREKFKSYIQKNISGPAAHGIILPLGLGNISMILLPEDEKDDLVIIHELKHSIDAFRKERIGKNRVISELIAFIKIKDEDFHSEAHFTEEQMELLCNGLKERYFEQYITVFNDSIEFGDFIDELCKILKVLVKKYTKSEFDRILFNTKDIEELKQLADL